MDLSLPLHFHLQRLNGRLYFSLATGRSNTSSSHPRNEGSAKGIDLDPSFRKARGFAVLFAVSGSRSGATNIDDWCNAVL